MRAALDAHRAHPPAPPRAPAAALRVEDYPAARRAGGQCIHCHQVNEFRRAALKAAGTWTRELVWAYPLPENVGITLEVDAGNRVRSVRPDSPAAAIGLKPGDRLRTLNGFAVASFADAQYALHRAPVRGTIPVTWQRGAQTMTANLPLADGWRKTNVTWRPSMLDVLPGLALYGEDLTAAEKMALGLSPKRLAFRQQQPIPKDAAAAGVRAGDIVVGIDGADLEMTVDQFLAHVRRNFLVGDRVTLNVLRDGKRVDLPMVLK